MKILPSVNRKPMSLVILLFHSVCNFPPICATVGYFKRKLRFCCISKTSKVTMKICWDRKNIKRIFFWQVLNMIIAMSSMHIVKTTYWLIVLYSIVLLNATRRSERHEREGNGQGCRVSRGGIQPQTCTKIPLAPLQLLKQTDFGRFITSAAWGCLHKWS